MALHQTRRRFLTGVSLSGVSLTGCLRRESFTDGEQISDTTHSIRSTSSVPTTEPTTTIRGRTRTTQTTTAFPLSAYSFERTPDLLQRAPKTHPPKLRLGLTNAATEPVGLGFGPTPPFSDPISGPSDATNRLVLFHPDMGPHTAPGTRIEGCWQLENDPTVAVNAIAKIRGLRPGDTLSETYALYTMPTNETCFPDGTYVFGDYPRSGSGLTPHSTRSNGRDTDYVSTALALRSPVARRSRVSRGAPKPQNRLATAVPARRPAASRTL